MTVDLALAYLAAGLSLLSAAIVLWREGQHVAYRAFAVGMVVFAAREVLGTEASTSVGAEALLWHRYRLLASSLLPGVWLLFALTFARAEERRFVRRWKWALAAAFVVPIALAVIGWSSLVVRPLLYDTPRWIVPIGRAGFWLHAVLLCGAVAVLVNLEATLRASSGGVRWHIKLTVLGLAALFGVEVFLVGQVMRYPFINTKLFPFQSAALLLAVGFVLFSLVRRRLGRFDVYPSDSLLFNSITLLVVGIILIVLALMGAPPVVVLVTLSGLALLLLSTEVRERVKEFLRRHLGRPSHDYRRLWDTFTERTSTIVEIEPLAAAITKITAETFGCSAATIWLVREGEGRLHLGGSSALSAEQAAEMLAEHEGGRAWLEALSSDLDGIVDLKDERLGEAAPEMARAAEARYSVALATNDKRPLGFLTVNERVTGQGFSHEDFTLLKTLAEQAAAAIGNRQLARKLQHAKEMETFQALSTFFVHDLKNLASRLSLVLQNLPAHYDKPAFRDDLLRTMEKSLSKIDTMTSRLSTLTEGLRLDCVETDVNALVEDAVAGLNGAMGERLELDLRDVPRMSLDPEQLHKVITNLVLNAREASEEAGRIVVATSRDKDWVLLAVSDHGCGMSRDFVETSLFKPFQTTKKQGLGIGLFHSKTIVEAHGGHIEVESAPGRGTTFRVFLPVSTPAPRPKER